MADGDQAQAQGSAGNTDIVTALQGVIRQITAGNAKLESGLTAMVAAVLAVFPATIFSGSFTLGAAATTVVNDGNVLTTSIILLSPTNAAAGTLMGSAKSLYISAKSAGVSFTVATASAAAAGGTENFSYVIVNL